MTRKFESDYRLRESDDVLVKMRAVLQDLDLRIDAVEIIAKAFKDGNRLDVDALVKSINSDFAQKSAAFQEVLDEIATGLTPDRILETPEKRFTSDDEIGSLQTADSNLSTALSSKLNSLTFVSHRDNTDNPHSVTKAQVGLGDVENIAPANMPVSEPQQEALDTKLNASGGTMSGGVVADTNSILLTDSAAPSVAGQIVAKRSTGHIHLFDGSIIRDFAPSKWEPIFDSDVGGQAYIDIDNFDLFKCLRISAALKTNGASGDFAWMYSTDGGANFVASSVYYSVFHCFQGSVSTGSALGAWGSLTAYGISANANSATVIDAVIERLPGKNAVYTISRFGGVGNGVDVVGLRTSYIGGGLLPASPINALRFFQTGNVNFSGHVLIEGMRA